MMLHVANDVSAHLKLIALVSNNNLKWSMISILSSFLSNLSTFWTAVHLTDELRLFLKFIQTRSIKAISSKRLIVTIWKKIEKEKFKISSVRHIVCLYTFT